jgi:hypothetical protein
VGGRVVFRRALVAADGPQQLPTALSAGVYVVRIATARGVVTRRLLVP